DLGDVFLANSKEAIWQILPTQSTRYNAFEAYLSAFFSPYDPSSGSLTDGLGNSFETGDRRKEVWVGVGSHGNNTHLYAHKYKAGNNTPPYTEYSTVLRLAELYLIRAEARLELGNLQGARDDLNTIRF